MSLPGVQKVGIDPSNSSGSDQSVELHEAILKHSCKQARIISLLGFLDAGESSCSMSEGIKTHHYSDQVSSQRACTESWELLCPL